jgi:hypothetical protein
MARRSPPELLPCCPHIPREEIVAAGHALQELMVGSYRTPLWAAAYVVNGGCSNDGFDYFRGWLIVQGREVFEHVVADPDALADLPVIHAQAPSEAYLECEDTLYIASRAHRAATGVASRDAMKERASAPGGCWKLRSIRLHQGTGGPR